MQIFMKAAMATLISDKADFRAKTITTETVIP